MKPQDQKPVYGSGPWEVDLARRELRALGILVPLGGRAFEIVEALIQSNGELVTKHELMGRVWPGAIVAEHTLHVHISAIRKALGSGRGILQTVSGRGYRLLGPWTLRRNSAPAEAGALEPRRTSGRAFLTNLPVATSDLIGRTTVTEQLHDLLLAYRVVTLAGPGGIGKTALAL